jgi:hypothetical protein
VASLQGVTGNSKILTLLSPIVVNILFDRVRDVDTLPEISGVQTPVSSEIGQRLQKSNSGCEDLVAPGGSI